MKKMFLSDRLFNNNKLSEAIYSIYLKMLDEKASLQVETETLFFGEGEDDEWDERLYISGYNVTFKNGAKIFVSHGVTIVWGDGPGVQHRSVRRLSSLAKKVYNTTKTVVSDVNEVRAADSLIKFVNGENNNG